MPKTEPFVGECVDLVEFSELVGLLDKSDSIEVFISAVVTGDVVVFGVVFDVTSVSRSEKLAIVMGFCDALLSVELSEVAVGKIGVKIIGEKPVLVSDMAGGATDVEAEAKGNMELVVSDSWGVFRVDETGTRLLVEGILAVSSDANRSWLDELACDVCLVGVGAEEVTLSASVDDGLKLEDVDKLIVEMGEVLPGSVGVDPNSIREAVTTAPALVLEVSDLVAETLVDWPVDFSIIVLLALEVEAWTTVDFNPWDEPVLAIDVMVFVEVRSANLLDANTGLVCNEEEVGCGLAAVAEPPDNGVEGVVTEDSADPVVLLSMTILLVATPPSVLSALVIFWLLVLSVDAADAKIVLTGDGGCE